ncbi:MAG: hypothetical protein WB493_16870 [Anaeromyxobacteraceae bacterium]
MKRALAILSALVLPLLSCAPWDAPASAEEVGPVLTPGPAPALAGDWVITMPMGTYTCTGAMHVDGATGQGTYTGCPGVSGTVLGSEGANQTVTFWFYPTGLAAHWMTGHMMDADWFGGTLRGAGWHGEIFDAHRAP